jgi:hypothetical protein
MDNHAQWVGTLTSRLAVGSCMKSEFRVPRLRMAILLFLVSLLLVPIATSGVAAHTGDYAPGPSIDPMDLLPVTLTLSGWAWRINAGCVSCVEYGNAVLELDGSAVARDNVSNVFDLYLIGELSLNTTDRTDNFTLELRGTRVSSAFFLKQVAGGSAPQVAEIEGVWFDYEEPMYVACEGRLGLPEPDNVATVYMFALRNGSAEGIAIPDSWLGKLTVIFDEVADAVVSGGTQAQVAIGNGLASLWQILVWWAT